MPNRIVRDWTDSDAVNRLSADAERLFIRLIMKADDYGLFHAKPSLVKSGCFPDTDVRVSDCAKWLNELEAEPLPLIRRYRIEANVPQWLSNGAAAAQDNDSGGKHYLQILNFNQRLRAKKAKFPLPPAFDGHMTDIRQTDDGHTSARNEAHSETETNGARPPGGGSSGEDVPITESPAFAKAVCDLGIEIYLGPKQRSKVKSLYDFAGDSAFREAFAVPHSRGINGGGAIAYAEKIIMGNKAKQELGHVRTSAALAQEDG